MNGFISVDRRIMNWKYWGNPKMVRALLYLIMNAVWKDSEVYGVALKRGQLLTGRKKLAFELGHSEQEIRTILSNLQSTNSITIQPTNKYSIITVCNYDTYQIAVDNINQQSNQQSSAKSTTYKEVNNKQVSKTICWSRDENWHLPEGFLEEMRKTYSYIDVTYEMEKMNQWLLSNPQRSNKKKWRQFVTNWLGRSNDKAKPTQQYIIATAN